MFEFILNTIAEFLHGPKVYYYDAKIGKLYTRVKKPNPNKVYGWQGNIKIGNQTVKTIITSLDGDFERPYEKPLFHICALIDSIDKVIKKTVLEMSKGHFKHLGYHIDFQQKFFLSTMFVYDETDGFSVDMEFHPYSEKHSKEGKHVGLTWTEGVLSNFYAK